MVAKVLRAFSKKILTKIKIAQPPVVRSALKPSQVGFDTYRFGWCAREVQENSVRSDPNYKIPNSKLFLQSYNSMGMDLAIPLL